MDWDRMEHHFTELVTLAPRERAIRLEEIRSDDSALAAHLESLVECAPQADRFFRQLPRVTAAVAADLVSSAGDSPGDGPALGQHAEPPSTVVAQYRIGHQLGRGGMGVVYQASDIRLDRPVALKFLSPHLWVDRAARERLLLEARAAAALDHPNICTVYEVGETPEGALFLAMAHCDGETLRDRLARGALGIDTAVDIASQIARALDAAHSRGIIHRDVKPANLMLTSAGTVKLLDFGLARLPDVTVTPSGLTPGTIAYMSPEQVRGETADARADLWSMGVVLYEMLVGQRPFRGDSQAAVLYAIMHDDPPHPSRLRADVPRALDDIVMRLLSRDREKRYATAAALLEDLGSVAHPDHAQRRRSRARGVEWVAVPVRGRRWIVGVVGAVIVAALVGIAVSLDRGGSPRIAAASRPSGDRVLVADFAASADDSTLGAVVAHALRIGLAHSSTLRVVGTPTVSSALQRMRRPPDAALDPALAREVATREGIKAILQGEVRRVGAGYLLTAALEDATTGTRIEGWRVTARDSARIPAAIERLIAEIRASGGETLASSDRPASLTTSSLSALRKHREGLQALHRGDYLRAIQSYEEATTLDPDFAMGHVMLGTALLSVGVGDPRVARAYHRAFLLRDRLTESERFGVEGVYAKHVLGDLPQAIEAFRHHVEVTRGAGGGLWYSSLGDALILRGQYREAEDVLQEARRVWPTPANQHGLAAVLLRRGDEAGARRVLEEAQSRRPRHPLLVVARASLAARAGDYATAHTIVDTGLAGPAVRRAPHGLAMLDAARGRLREAVEHLRVVEQDHAARGLVYEAGKTAAAIGILRVRIDGTDSAAAEVERMLTALPTSERSRYSYLSLAIFFASAADARRAESMLDEYRRAVPEEFRGADRWLEHRARAAIHLAQGRPRAAINELRIANSHAPVNIGPFDLHRLTIDHYPELARAYDRAGMSDSALAIYERYLAVPELDRVNMDAVELGDALRRAAELHAARGDLRRAAAHYRRLADLWHDADPEPRAAARAAAARAASLSVD